MAWFIAAGYKGKDLVTLNRVRKHQQVLFLSDNLGASGGSWDKQYLQKRRIGDHWLSMKFPREEIMEPEMGFWRRAIAQVVLRGPAQSCLGRLKTGGHKVWEWQVQESKGHLYRQCNNHVVVYRHIWRGQYKRLRTSRSGRMRGEEA
jgi:hypothetical protein